MVKGSFICVFSATWAWETSFQYVFTMPAAPPPFPGKFTPANQSLTRWLKVTALLAVFTAQLATHGDPSCGESKPDSLWTCEFRYFRVLGYVQQGRIDAPNHTTRLRLCFSVHCESLGICYAAEKTARLEGIAFVILVTDTDRHSPSLST